jgi:hypothetical protein
MTKGRRGEGAATAEEVVSVVPTDGAPEPRYARRLSDKILIAFHHACDQNDIGVAWELLNVLEFTAMRHPHHPVGADRRAQASLVAAHERLWQMRYVVSEDR